MEGQTDGLDEQSKSVPSVRYTDGINTLKL